MIKFLQLKNWSFNRIQFTIDKNELDSYQYITINNINILHGIYDIIRNDMQQGEEKPYSKNLGRSIIEDMGFFDHCGNRKKLMSWKSFEEYLPCVIYKFEINGDIIKLIPLNYNSYKYSDIEKLVKIL